MLIERRALAQERRMVPESIARFIGDASDCAKLQLKPVGNLPHTFEPGRIPPVLKSYERQPNWRLRPLIFGVTVSFVGNNSSCAAFRGSSTLRVNVGPSWPRESLKEAHWTDGRSPMAKWNEFKTALLNRKPAGFAAE
jgi:hypothetical protein